MRSLGFRRFFSSRFFVSPPRSSSSAAASSAGPSSLPPPPLFSSTTVDQGEIDRFAALADSWWNEEGPMKALRSMNRLRVPWIRDTLLQIRQRQAVNNTDRVKSSSAIGSDYLIGQQPSPISHRIVKPTSSDGHHVELSTIVADRSIVPSSSSSPTSSAHPLDGFRILDVGCGAGFLTEPLARLGAHVVGIDPTVENIRVATEHANRQKDELGFEKRLVYYSKTVEEMRDDENGQFDAVVASEVVEHVANRESFVDNCLRLVKPGGGAVFFTTINRTTTSRVLAIWMAENVLRIVPRGMHDWEKFVDPNELQNAVEKKGDCRVRMIHGMFYNPLNNRWSWVRNTNVSYALCGVKN